MSKLGADEEQLQHLTVSVLVEHWLNKRSQKEGNQNNSSSCDKGNLDDEKTRKIHAHQKATHDRRLRKRMQVEIMNSLRFSENYFGSDTHQKKLSSRD